MKILLITTDITIVGGIERVISNLTDFLINNYNYDIEIVSLFENKINGDKTNFKFNKNIKIYYHKLNNNNKKASNSKILILFELIKYYLILFKNIRCILKERKGRYDVVMTFHSSISIATILNKGIFKGKIVVTEHSNYECVDKLTLFLRKVFFKKANKVVVLTNNAKEQYQKFMNNIEVIPNPVSIKSDFVSPLKNNRIVAVGRLHPEKGFDRAIEIFNLIHKDNKEWIMDIIGEGQEKSKLQELINNYNLQNQVNILPFSKNIKKEFLTSDINIITSRNEAFSLVLLESMECGVPTISFDLNGPREIINNNEDGVIVGDGQIRDFANELSIIMNNLELRKKYAANAKNKAQIYSIVNIGQKWNRLFNNL